MLLRFPAARKPAAAAVWRGASICRDRDIVDEARAAEMHRGQQPRRPAPASPTMAPRSRRVAQFEVLDREAELRSARRSSRASTGPGASPCGDVGGGLPHHPVQVRRDPTLLGRQVDVARRQRRARPARARSAPRRSRPAGRGRAPCAAPPSAAGSPSRRKTRRRARPGSAAWRRPSRPRRNGRDAARRTAPRSAPPTEIVVAKPSGYISSTAGMKTRSTAAAVSLARSSASGRG